jgi:hypothetical protein
MGSPTAKIACAFAVHRFDNVIAALAKKVVDGKPDQYFVIHNKDGGGDGAVLGRSPVFDEVISFSH